MSPLVIPCSLLLLACVGLFGLVAWLDRRRAQRPMPLPRLVRVEALRPPRPFPGPPKLGQQPPKDAA